MPRKFPDLAELVYFGFFLYNIPAVFVNTYNATGGPPPTQTKHPMCAALFSCGREDPGLETGIHPHSIHTEQTPDLPVPPTRSEQFYLLINLFLDFLTTHPTLHSASANNRMVNRRGDAVLDVRGNPQIEEKPRLKIENQIQMQGSMSKVRFEPGSTEEKRKKRHH